MYLEEFKNEITRTFDDYLLPMWKNKYSKGTYILVDTYGLTDNVFAIRCPSMTIGYIKFDGTYPNDMTIKRIGLYDHYLDNFSMVYDMKLLSLDLNQWLGKKLIIEERIEDDGKD